MLNRLVAFFRPPLLEDEGRTRAASLLNAVLLVLLLGISLSGVVTTITSSSPLTTALLNVSLFGWITVLYLLHKRGYVVAVSLALVISLWIIIHSANAALGSLNGSILSASVLVVVLAGLLLGGRGALIFAILNLLALLATNLALASHWLSGPFRIESAPNQAVVMATIYAIAALLLYIATRRLNEAFSRLRSSASLARTTLEQLRTTSVSKSYMDNIIQSMRNLLLVLNPDGTIQTANPAACTLLGYTESEMIGLPFAEIAPDGPTIQTLITQNGIQNAAYAFKARDGRRVPVEFSSAVMLRDGGIEGIVCVAEDESAREQAEERRKRDEVVYRALFEQTTDAVFILDLDGRPLAVNQRAADMLGYTTDDLMGMRYGDLVSDTELDKTDITLRALTEGDSAPVYERLLRRKDGTEFPVEVSAQLVRDAHGRPLHIQRHLRDITERRQTEEQLRSQAELLQNVSDAIISTKLDSTIRSWNKAAEQVYGWKAEEVIGRSLTDIVRTTYGTGDNEEAIKRQYFARGYWRSEVTQQRRDGQLLHILSSVSLLRNSKGLPIGTVAVNHDITKRKQAEEELQRRVEQMALLRQIDSEIGSTLDLEKVLLFALNAAVGMSGADAGFICVVDEAGQMHIAHRYGGYQAVAVAEGTHPTNDFGVVGRAMRTLQPILVTDVRDDGDYVAEIPETRALMAIPLVSHEQLVGIIDLETVQTDHFTPEVFDFIKLLAGRLAAAIENARLYRISQTQLNELQTLYTDIKQLEQLKTDMIRIASHDLRGPVGVINGYLELVRMDVYDRMNADEQDYVESIARQVERMHGIINDILSLERIHQVAKDRINERIDLHELVNNVVQNHQPEAETKAQQLGLLPSESSNGALTVQGDPRQLYEAISNLVTNAIKYTPTGGTVQVAMQQAGSRARIEVRDTGYGIPADQQPRLFEPFYRVKMDETAGIDGTGLGLHLVKNIVERHAGEISVQSVYGQGSTFAVELPLAKAETS
ncbi:MAG: PAS domain-containing sensor histidine kinase [bacterium]|nr:PAS domain-containing sensor histidine kinase [bacterium]